MIAPGPDLFDRIASELVAAKARYVKEGRAMYAADIAAVIKVRFPDLQECPAKADSRPNKAHSSPFGDRRHIPPTPEQVAAYSASIGFDLKGADFCDFYQSKGWVVGKSKMKDWQAAVRTWQRSRNTPVTPTSTRDYSRLS